ncbi:MAG: hypothetical protein AB1552_04480 [Nitrospirota bacterium]
MLKKLELTVERLYLFYQKLFTSDHDASAFFHQLSLDEQSHAEIIDYQIRIIRKNRGLFKDVEYDIETPAQMISDIEKLVSKREHFEKIRTMAESRGYLV